MFGLWSFKGSGGDLEPLLEFVRGGSFTRLARFSHMLFTLLMREPGCLVLCVRSGAGVGSDGLAPLSRSHKY